MRKHNKGKSKVFHIKCFKKVCSPDKFYIKCVSQRCLVVKVAIIQTGNVYQLLVNWTSKQLYKTKGVFTIKSIGVNI